MIFEKLSYRLYPHILFHSIQQYLYYLALILCLQYLALASEKKTDAI